MAIYLFYAFYPICRIGETAGQQDIQCTLGYDLDIAKLNNLCWISKFPSNPPLGCCRGGGILLYFSNLFRESVGKSKFSVLPSMQQGTKSSEILFAQTGQLFFRLSTREKKEVVQLVMKLIVCCFILSAK